MEYQKEIHSKESPIERESRLNKDIEYHKEKCFKESLIETESRLIKDKGIIRRNVSKRIL